jgi:hypothetical protein
MAKKFLISPDESGHKEKRKLRNLINFRRRNE